jgi:hypothetical protein
MFEDSTFQAACHADVENGVVFVGDDVNEVDDAEGIVGGPSTSSG